MKEKTICITGGHQTPGIAVIEAIRTSHPQWNIVWIGRRYAFEGSRVIAPEYALIRSMNIPFEDLNTGRVDRSKGIYGLFSLFKIPLSIWQSVRIFQKIKPDLVVSFGGYIAFPVAVAAYIMHIPIITHEQTHAFGLANTVIAKIAQKVCVSYPETLALVSKQKGVLTGLPIRSGIFAPPSYPSFTIPKEQVPILYITGGSTGAQSLNEKIFPMIAELVKEMVVVHQTGDISFQKAQSIKTNLRAEGGRYIIAPFFSVSDVSWMYTHADVVVGRSGANTVAEISAFQKKAVFVPLPWAGGNEQTTNAREYQKTGNAVIIKQENVTAASFTKAVDELLKTSKNHVQQNVVPQSEGAVNVVKEIDTLLSSYERN
jgi:UDP-N-acetylglucosamine--N-acetylmuramyl-(pentapeptide) pyrophosphoryl-undecaprenol N-acetylglucosamine transferase